MVIATSHRTCHTPVVTPAQVDCSNIARVLEATARLHNYCIDQNCSPPGTFIPPMEDLWWQRTASPRAMAAGRAPMAPVADMSPVFSHVSDVRAICGTGRINLTNRQLAVKAVELSGLEAPDSSGQWTREAARKRRATQCGRDLSKWRVENSACCMRFVGVEA
jgi:hypothetical protein